MKFKLKAQNKPTRKKSKVEETKSNINTKMISTKNNFTPDEN